MNSDLLARVFDSIPDEILVLDTDMVIQGANASFLRGNDLTLEEVRGLHCYEVSKGVRGECRVAVDNCPFQKVMSGGGTDFHTRKNFDADGNVRYVAIVGAPLIDADGAVAGMVEMTRDITHRILLERELAASEVRLQHFLELAPLATYVKNRQSQYVAVNPSACALLGRTKSEILGRTDLEILPREVAEQWGRGDREVLQEGREVTIETEITSGGRHVFLSSVKYPVLDGLGRVTAVCGLLKDATELREAEAELNQIREHLQNILDNSPVIITTTDLDHRIVSFNRGAEASLGYTAAEVIGMPFEALFHSKDEIQTLLRRVGSEIAVQDYESVMRRKDGSDLPVSVTLSQLRDSSDTTIGTVGMSKDISHRRALVKQIMQSERQVAVGRLASGVAPEINNPLAIIAEIAGYLYDLCAEGPGAESADLLAELRSGLPKILEYVRRGRSITSRLLTFARKTEARVEVCDVNPALREIMGFLVKEAEIVGIKIHQDYEPDLPRARVDEMQLQEVCINLITNAIHALSAERRGHVWIATRRRESKVEISIRDDGPGIAEEVRDRLFDPFVSTKPPGQGTGLGLSICYGIVKRYDGEIRVETAEGEGTTFTVRVPAVREPPPDTVPSTESGTSHQGG